MVTEPKHREQKRISLINKTIKLEKQAEKLKKESDLLLEESFSIKMKIYRGDY